MHRENKIDILLPTYNGEKLPSTDYWFTVEYLPQNGTTTQIFKAHFSLKR